MNNKQSNHRYQRGNDVLGQILTIIGIVIVGIALIQEVGQGWLW